MKKSLNVCLPEVFVPTDIEDLNLIIDNTIEKCEEEGVLFSKKNEEEVLNMLSVALIMTSEILKNRLKKEREKNGVKFQKPFLV